MYTILKRYLRVFSLRFLRRKFGMSFMHRSPNSFSSTLWSTATVKSRHPSTKCLTLCVNLNPTKVTHQPFQQQKGSWNEHRQCFCVSQKPIPSLFLSVARQVEPLLSKISTPAWMLSHMCCLDVAKASVSWSDYWKGVDGFRRSLKGSMVAVIAKV